MPKLQRNVRVSDKGIPARSVRPAKSIGSNCEDDAPTEGLTETFAAEVDGNLPDGDATSVAEGDRDEPLDIEGGSE